MNAAPIVMVAIGVLLVSAILIPVVDVQTDDNTLDIVVIDGQSNAQYWGWTTNNICNPTTMETYWNETPSHNLYYYGTDVPVQYGTVYTEPIYDTTFESYDIHPMYEDGHWKIGGYEPGIGYYLSERSDHDVLVINVGVGAAPVQWLSPNGAGGRFAQAVLNDALSKIEGYTHLDFLGVVWAQGESNRNSTVDYYIEYFNLVMKMYQKYGLDDFYIIATRDAVGGNSITAQNQLAETYSNVQITTEIANTFTTSNGLLNTDNLHYTQQGRSVISEIVGNAIEYNEHKSNEIVNQLISVIPVIVLASLTIGAVTLFIKTRRN